MENLWAHIGRLFTFVTIFATTAALTGMMLKSCDTNEWRRHRNKPILYDPIDMRKEEDDNHKKYCVIAV